MELETRTIEATELRATPAADGKPAQLAGYAAVFNSESLDLGGFRETISPGAFSDSLANQGDIRALRNHEDGQLLGRTANATLRLREDAKGLSFELDVPDTSYARDMMTLVNRGDVRGMSFGFNVNKDDDTWEKRDGKLYRTLRSVALGEVSVVDSPAYPSTSLSVRVAPDAISRAKELSEEIPEYISEKISRDAQIRKIVLAET